VRRVLITLVIGSTFLYPVSISRAATPSNYFVSNAGKDSNPGTLAKPFKTISHCVTVAAPNETCNLRSGVYRETVKPNDSLTIQSYKNEKATIDGRELISGFTSDKPNQFVANIKLRNDDTNQIFFGDQAGTEAKWPNGPDVFHPNWQRITNMADSSTLSDSLMPPDISGNGLIKFWSGDDAWAAQTAEFSSEMNKSLSFKLDGSRSDQWIAPKVGGLYYLYNNIAFLDTSYEWFYDSTAQKLYVQLPSGKTPSAVPISYKSRDVAVDISGHHGIKIKNIKIFASTIVSNSTSSANLIDGIQARYISEVSRLTDNSPEHPWQGSFEVDHVFQTGIMLNGYGNTLENSIIDQSACNGVLVTGRNNVVKNNLISNAGYLFNMCSGIFITGPGHKITNNTLYHMGRAAILPINLWNPILNQKVEAPTNVEISYNNIFDFGLLGFDVGGIYLAVDAVDTGLKIHHNWIHDSIYPDPKPFSKEIPNPTEAGIYLDNNTSEVEAYQNILWNLGSFPFWINSQMPGDHSKANNNFIHNNTIINPAEFGSIGELGPFPNCGTTRIENNKMSTSVSHITEPTCADSNNSSLAAGADQMTKVIIPGCSFTECKVLARKPPTFS
jgi:hypothetical protein